MFQHHYENASPVPEPDSPPPLVVTLPRGHLCARPTAPPSLFALLLAAAKLIRQAPLVLGQPGDRAAAHGPSNPTATPIESRPARLAIRAERALPTVPSLDRSKERRAPSPEPIRAM